MVHVTSIIIKTREIWSLTHYTILNSNRLTMVWVDSCPQFLIPIPHNVEILKLIHIPHTSLLVTLTESAVHVFDQYSLLPITYHKRAEESINQHGNNLNIKTKHVSVNTASLQKLNNVNLFVHTDSNYVIIYLMNLTLSRTMYEVSSPKNDQVLQSGLPHSDTTLHNSLASFIKNATKTIIQGNQKAQVNLENIEHFNNQAIEDEWGNFSIDLVKLSVFKVLKIGMGLQRYWLKQNSHNLLIFNDKNDKASVDETEETSPDNFFQIINIQNFNNEIFKLSEFEWYNSGQNIIYINYNIFYNYFLFINDQFEAWILRFDNSDGEVKPVGTKLYQFLDLTMTTKIHIAFNPQCDLFLLVIDSKIKLFKREPESLVYVKDINVAGDNIKTTWSSCGSFFAVVDSKSGHWSLHSKFGSVSFSSGEILKELDGVYEENRGFLKASTITISPNASVLYIINHDKTKLYYVNLLTLTGHCDSTFYNQEYISVIQNNKSFIRFPMLPKFKRIINQIEHYNGHSSKSVKSVNGKFVISRSSSNQFAVSYGDNISISTPYSTSGNDINHILWFNFRNYYMDALNIMDHFWFNDYLVLVNRKLNDDYESDGDAHDTNDHHLVDEIIVLNTTMSKYGCGGEDFVFDSDLILWRYDFKTTFISFQLLKVSDNVAQVLILTTDYRLVIIELNDNKLIARESSSTNLQDYKDQQNYKIFIGVNKTIHLSTIQNKISLRDIVQATMINKKHFLFLLNTGEFYLLKNQSRSGMLNSNPVNAVKPSNMYDLIKINQSIELFKLQTVNFQDTSINYIYLFTGDNLLIYDLEVLVDHAFDNYTHVVDGLESPELNMTDAIKIEIDNYQPLQFDVRATIGGYKSLDLIVMEKLMVDRASAGGLIIRNKISHKLILNNFIEFDLLHNFDDATNAVTFGKYDMFENYDYCLELLLFKYLTEENNLVLENVIQLIEMTQHSEFIYIQCLRKIEIGYWKKFFTVLKTTPVEFMSRLIGMEDVALCYNYLIVHLNFKKEGDVPTDSLLDSNDREVILKIMVLLDKAKKWDWCFELCRFIKILEPSGDLLGVINSTLR